jgi:hypothetical protein
MRAAVPSAQERGVVPPPPAQSCFHGGSGPSYVKVCVSKRGNIVKLQAPKGTEHIDVGAVYEGYVLCKGITTSVAHDTAGSQAGFLAPKITQPKGANTLPLTITRTTADGSFRLSQEFGFDAARREFSITMRLKNLSGVTQTSVGMARAVDLDVDGDAPDDVWDRSNDGVWARDEQAVGLFAGSLGVTHGTLAQDFGSFTSGIGSGSCAPVIVPTTPFTADGAGDVGYGFASIAPRATTHPVVFTYRVF